MADLFVSVVAISPKPSQAATVSTNPGQGDSDVSGIHSDIQKTKVNTPGGQQK